MNMNIGLLIILISLIGSISNWLNWKFLNYSFVRILYYLGTVVHELSHAFFCILTGARIRDIVIFSKQPCVVHTKSKVPYLGDLLISLAPIIGGLVFVFLLNTYILKTAFHIPQIYGWQSFFLAPLKLLAQLNLLRWKDWILILLFLNMGAMIGPSWKDLKNIWPLLILLLFINSSFLAQFGWVVVVLIMANIYIQIILIVIVELVEIILNSLFWGPDSLHK